ncbi:ATP-dependent RecD-like DNA helicase [Actinobacillus pleuropneumoniae]|uniref:ATP-dependent DNA helicase n=1 Tax=Actinobacillus pleuropneumoniae TaxID=715 RepID=UPI00202093D9|nr:ATP-dependent RecD-like DNA helicase [Actinobacillus pleuropneumoniae]MCL7720922.1 ATP-dependent RecD-like DNA helicase [Actinobacillus pleuropneumoniae]MCL7726600.1 ATP-dependent RecD-like DNA helicase [Actinobacillus pleuropneumoniae]MCL7729104.1 ATP-dependent RecD-like DNA helicase [Actinobacillus pleuropneumoniae]
MLKIDKAILDTDKVICKNINVFDESERGLLSQNILAQLRNFVEYISQKIYSNGEDIDPNNYTNKKSAWEYIKSQGNLNFLYKFHSLLQKSVSHYTLDENGSERLMLKYYEYLLKIRDFLRKEYNIEVLCNMNEFPLNLDNSQKELYGKISDAIEARRYSYEYLEYQDRYYIQKIKPFFINYNIYYEITFTLADDKVSKFDRIIAFTKLNILHNYSVQLKVREEYIDILGREMPIKIIDDWQPSIRSCELKNFAKIFNVQPISSSSIEYINLMKELKYNQLDLVEILKLSDFYYDEFRKRVLYNARTENFIKLLDFCRDLYFSNKERNNVIIYLLYRMNNKIIKSQLNDNKCSKLSNLYLQWGCIPFDQMPFTTSLVNHNPKIHDLFDCIDYNERQHEFLARLIKNNIEQKEVLFTPIKEISGFDDIPSLIEKYNSSLYPKHTGRKLIEYKGYLSMNNYVNDCINIIQEIQKLSELQVSGYSDSVNSWLENGNYVIDCEEKLGLLRNMFDNSRVAIIYGAAGTGKSTFINHISHFWSGNNKLYLANTNPAINNLKRKVSAQNCNFMTISRFLSSRNISCEYDLLIIDECSTVSNKDMKAILEKTKYKLMVLVGDIFQIESILFGNWFNILRKFVNQSSIIELTKPYRTTSNDLLTVWDRVRTLDMAILEPIVKNNYSMYLDDSVLDNPQDDEIILCLNYDGIYGINNINRFLQSSNPNPSVPWGVNTYKIGDPILFNESERFSPLIHNNMKGKIVHIKKEDESICFEIELDIKINEIDAEPYDFNIIETDSSSNSVIGFTVNKYPGTDEDDDTSSAIVPFQVAYAISIHKAQGLEYESVKIIITNEIEEMVNHSIFYTAITRAKENLRIYWTPETEKFVLENFKLKDFSRDARLLKGIINS